MRTNGSQSGAEYNIALIGCLGVGKSAMTVKYLTRRFINEYDPYSEDCYEKNDCIDGQDCTINIMDTCDTECSSPDRYLTWADSFIIVYSITSRVSFERARCYLEMVAQCQRLRGGDTTCCVLCGNKMDLERYREVSRDEGLELATGYGSVFLESTAAEEQEHVEKVFEEATRRARVVKPVQCVSRPPPSTTSTNADTSNTNIYSQLSSQETPLLAALLAQGVGNGNNTLSTRALRRAKSPHPPPPPSSHHYKCDTIPTDHIALTTPSITTLHLPINYIKEGLQSDVNSNGPLKSNLPKRTSSSFRLFNKGLKNIFLNTPVAQDSGIGATASTAI